MLRAMGALLVCIALICGAALGVPARADVDEDIKDLEENETWILVSQVIDAQDPQAAVELLLAAVEKPDVTLSNLADCLLALSFREDIPREDLRRLSDIVLGKAYEMEDTDPEALGAILEADAAVLFENEMTEEAERILADAVARDPANADMRVSQMYLMYQYADTDRTLALLKESLKDFGDVPELYILQAWLLGEQYRYDEAIAAMRAAVRLNQSAEDEEALLFAYHHLYQIEEAAGQYEAALRDLDRVIGVTGGQEEFLERAFFKLWTLYDPRAALVDLNALAHRFPDDPTVPFLQLHANILLEDDDAADAAADSPLFSDAYKTFAHGVAAFYRDDAAAAAANLDSYIEQNPEDFSAFFYRGLVALHAEMDHAAAQRFLDQAYELAGDDPNVQFARGALLYNQGRWSEAEVVFWNAASPGGDNASYRRLVRLLYAQGRGAEAKEALDEALTRFPGSYETLYTRYLYEDAAGDIQAANGTWQEISARFPFMVEDQPLIPAIYLAELGDSDGARALLAEHAPKTCIQHIQAAYTWLFLGEYELAGQSLDTAKIVLDALEASPGTYNALAITVATARAELALAQGDEAGCLAHLDAACQLGWFPHEVRLSWTLRPILDSQGYQDLLAKYPVQ